MTHDNINLSRNNPAVIAIACNGKSVVSEPSALPMTVDNAVSDQGEKRAFGMLHDIPKALANSGARYRIRTCDLCLRRAALYPAELIARRESFITQLPGICNR